jgi:hypothetical protein
MPFGKHRGLEIGEIPGSYLEWLLTIDLRPHLRRAVERELVARSHHGYGRDYGPPREPHSSQPAGVAVSVTRDDVGLLKELFESGYRQMALRYHPDRPRGDTQLMTRLNLLIETLRRQLSTQH